jgi:hypothetical protein
MGGQVSEEAYSQLKYYFDELKAINKPAENLNAALKNTAVNLNQAAYEIGIELKSGKHKY